MNYRVFVSIFAFLFLFGLSFSALSTCSASISSCCIINDSGNGFDYTLSSNVNNNAANSTCIDISLSNSTLNLAGFNLTNSTGSSYNAIKTNSDNVTISNGTVKNSTIGVFVASNNVTISNITFTTFESTDSNLYAIYSSNTIYDLTVTNSTFSNLSTNTDALDLTKAIRLTANSLTFSNVRRPFEFNNATDSNISFNSINNCDYALDMRSTHNTIFDSNNISNCYVALEFATSNSNLTVTNNNLTNNFFSFDVSSTSNSWFDVFAFLNLTGTTVDGKSIMKTGNLSGITINSSNNTAFIMLYNVSNSVIENMDLSFSYPLLVLDNSNNVTINNVTANYSDNSIYVNGSSNVTIRSSNIGSSDKLPSLGLRISFSNGFNLSDSTVYGESGVYGFSGTFGNDSILNSNTIYGSSYGFYLDPSNNASNVTLSNNNVNYVSSPSPSTINGRYSATRFNQDSAVVGGANCNLDVFLYNSARALRIGSIENFLLSSNTISHFPIGLTIDSAFGNITSNTITNSSEGMYILDSSNVIASLNTIGSLTNPTSSAHSSCDPFRLQLRAKNSSVEFTSNTLSGDVYGLQYTGVNLSANATSSPAASPYESSRDQFIEITNVTSSGSANITFNYSNNLVQESTLKMFRYNGSWANVSDILGVSCTLNTSSDYIKCDNVTSFSTFGLFGTALLSGDGGEESDPPGSLGQLEVSATSSCGLGMMLATVLDSNNNPVENAQVLVRVQNGAYVSGSPFTTNSNGQVEFTNPVEGTIYEFQADKSPDYEDSIKVYETFNCEVGVETQGFEVNYDLNCEEKSITFTPSTCGPYSTSDVSSGLSEADPCPAGGCIFACPFSVYSFSSPGEESVTFSAEGYSDKIVIVDTSICFDEAVEDTLEVSTDINCEAKTVTFTPSVCANEIHVSSGLTYTDQTCDGIECAIACDSPRTYSFSSPGEESVTFSAEGYSDKVVLVDTSICEDESEKPDQPEDEITVIVTLPDGTEEEITEDTSISDQFGPGSYTVSTYVDGELVSKEVIVVEKQEDDLTTFLSENSQLCISLVLLLLILGFYLYWRKRQQDENRKSQRKK